VKLALLKAFAAAGLGYGARMEIEEVLEPDQARELVGSNKATALDIREDEQWREKRVPGARHADEDNLEATLDEIDEEQILLVVCEDGKRSAELAGKLRDDGRDAASIDGGMKAWEKEKLPLQPSTDPADDAKV
jgi:rhodanese-related sulfurtransferase